MQEDNRKKKAQARQGTEPVQSADKVQKERLSHLNRANVKKIGVLEGAGQRIAGRMDGGRGLPREEKGQWMSPHLQREIHSFDEFCDRQWGSFQIHSEENFAKLARLMDDIGSTKARLAEEEDTLHRLAGVEPEISRNHGEENLSEKQLIARRTRERDRGLAAQSARVRGLQEELKSKSLAFMNLYHILQEEIHSISMICGRVRDHVMQRMDLYWNAALCRHPQSDHMPASPDVLLTSVAEEEYRKRHEDLLNRAGAMNRILSAIPEDRSTETKEETA